MDTIKIWKTGYGFTVAGVFVHESALSPRTRQPLPVGTPIYGQIEKDPKGRRYVRAHWGEAAGRAAEADAREAAWQARCAQREALLKEWGPIIRARSPEVVRTTRDLTFSLERLTAWVSIIEELRFSKLETDPQDLQEEDYKTGRRREYETTWEVVSTDVEWDNACHQAGARQVVRCADRPEETRTRKCAWALTPTRAVINKDNKDGTWNVTVYWTFQGPEPGSVPGAEIGSLDLVLRPEPGTYIGFRVSAVPEGKQTSWSSAYESDDGRGTRRDSGTVTHTGEWVTIVKALEHSWAPGLRFGVIELTPADPEATHGLMRRMLVVEDPHGDLCCADAVRVSGTDYNQTVKWSVIRCRESAEGTLKSVFPWREVGSD